MARPTRKIVTIRFRNRKGQFTKYRKEKWLAKEYYLKGRHLISKEPLQKINITWSKYVPFYALQKAKTMAKRLKIKLPKAADPKFFKKIRRDVKRGKLTDDEAYDLIRQYFRTL